MEIKCTVTIQGSKEEIWNIITNIENAAATIGGIESVKVLEKPDQGLIGLKWQETRTVFGKSATETMWITEALDNEYYWTRAENHGMVYKSGMSLKEVNGATELTMTFKSEAQRFGSRILSATMGLMMKNATKKMILKDLEDIKAKVESKSAVS